jgi:hypothetical protein
MNNNGFVSPQMLNQGLQKGDYLGRAMAPPPMAGYGQNQSPDALTTRLDQFGNPQTPNYGPGTSGWGNPDSQSNVPYMQDPKSTMGIAQMIMQHPAILDFLARPSTTPNRSR